MRLCLPGFLAAAIVFAQAPPAPDPELFLCDLSFAGGRAVIGEPRNISNNPGYDNQPFFTADGSAVLFTSVRGGRKPEVIKGAATGSDIYRYDIPTGTLKQLTDTLESEYSPTVTPDGRHFSTVRVEVDGTQRLWRFAIDGGEPTLLLPDVKPVGYHAWGGTDLVALFVLGDPPTLQLADVTSGRALTLGRNIGRSLQRIPGGGLSFIQRQIGERGELRLHVMELDPAKRTSSRLVDLPAGVTEADLAWTPDGRMLMAHDGALQSWRRGEREMSRVADLAAAGLRGVTRLAVSPRGGRVVFAAQP
jgi:hypothetical protein